MRTLTLTTLGLTVLSLLLLGLPCAAQADHGAGPIVGVKQATVTAGAAPDAGSSDVAQTAMAMALSHGGSAGEAQGAGSSPTSSGAGAQSGPGIGGEQPSTTGDVAAPAQGADEATAALQPAVTVAQPAPNAKQPAPNAEQPAEIAPQAGAQVTDARASGISEAVQEAMAQARSDQPQQASGSEGVAAAESSETTQLILQVQISECIVHCVGIRQYQNAAQQSLTVQSLAAAPPAQGQRATLTAQQGSQAASSVTRIQLGCIEHCWHAATSTADAPAVASYVKELERLLQELCRQIAAAMSASAMVTPGEQGAVKQLSLQGQSAAAGMLAQVQSATQASSTVALYRGPAPAGAPETALATGATSYEAIDRTEQGIWQLQIGCLVFCQETEQYQRASQSNEVVQAPEPGASGAAGAVAEVTQLIWQAQIGCLYWCIDTSQQQIAETENSLPAVQRESKPPQAGKPKPVGTSPAAGGPVAPSPAAGSGALSSASPVQGGATGTAATAAQARMLEGTAVLFATSPSPSSLHGGRTKRAEWHTAQMLHVRFLAVAAAAARGPRGARGARASLSTRRTSSRPRSASSQPSEGGAATVTALSAGTAIGSRGRSRSPLPAVALLAAIALCALSVLRIAALCARRRSQAVGAD